MTNGSAGTRSVWLNNMSKDAVNYFVKNKVKFAAVSVPHRASPYGSAKIYVLASAVHHNGKSVNVVLDQEAYALHYNMLGEDGKSIRVHDAPVLATDLQARVNDRQKISLEARAKALAEKVAPAIEPNPPKSDTSFKFQFNK